MYHCVECNLVFRLLLWTHEANLITLKWTGISIDCTMHNEHAVIHWPTNGIRYHGKKKKKLSTRKRMHRRSIVLLSISINNTWTHWIDQKWQNRFDAEEEEQIVMWNDDSVSFRSHFVSFCRSIDFQIAIYTWMLVTFGANVSRSGCCCRP